MRAPTPSTRAVPLNAYSRSCWPGICHGSAVGVKHYFAGSIRGSTPSDSIPWASILSIEPSSNLRAKSYQSSGDILGCKTSAIFRPTSRAESRATLSASSRLYRVSCMSVTLHTLVNQHLPTVAHQQRQSLHAHPQLPRLPARVAWVQVVPLNGAAVLVRQG